MALQLIIGASGSGKTYHANRMIMDEAIKNPDKMYYVVVPEQLNLSMHNTFCISAQPKHSLTLMLYHLKDSQNVYCRVVVWICRIW